jgi:hypothetical protein
MSQVSLALATRQPEVTCGPSIAIMKRVKQFGRLPDTGNAIKYSQNVDCKSASMSGNCFIESRILI